jgi:hypothetical protein
MFRRAGTYDRHSAMLLRIGARDELAVVLAEKPLSRPNGPIVHLHASPPLLTRRGAAVAAPNDEFGRSELQLP